MEDFSCFFFFLSKYFFFSRAVLQKIGQMLNGDGNALNLSNNFFFCLLSNYFNFLGTFASFSLCFGNGVLCTTKNPVDITAAV